MPDLSDFADRLHYENRRSYTKEQGNVAYLDGTPLKRPAKMPAFQRVIALVFVIAAVAIGAYFLRTTVVAAWEEAATAEQTIKDNLAREASINTVPNMASMVVLDDESIKAQFASQGFVVFDASVQEESNDMILYKLPSDMSLNDGAVMVTQGINTLNAQQASQLLNGAWYFQTERVNGTSMVVRYADFSTGDPEIAVQNAIQHQGFDVNTITATGVDDSGNTFSSGTLQKEDGSLYTWKVSSLMLDDMYSIQGMPEDACYVGVRVTSA